MSHTWDPDRYLAYADERGRPFVDLLARVPAENPRVVVDLGCGPGTLTALLAARWPSADVTGVDSSPVRSTCARTASSSRSTTALLHCPVLPAMKLSERARCRLASMPIHPTANMPSN